MQFKELTSFFEKMEQTASRLTLISILSDLFKASHKDEICQIVYLAQGRVAPFYAPIEIGMADKNVAAAIGLAYGVEREKVLQMYDKLGDMGTVAAQLSKEQRAKSKELTVDHVFQTLTEIAHTGGEGSVDKKQKTLVELLQQCDEISAKHLVRIPLGNNRLGIGDPTILDGLATAKLGDKLNRKLLEKAYNETSDLGLIATTLWEGGLEAVQKLKITVGRPIRSELCERLPNPEKVFEKMGESVHATPKYDGFRVQIHKNGDKVEMFSRNLEDMTHMFPDLIEGVKKQIKVKSVILDSEAMAYQPESEEFLPFQETTKRRRKHNIEEVAKNLPLKAFVFDILYYDGKSLIDIPLVERMEYIKKTISGDEVLIPAPAKILTKPEDLQLMLDDSISKGLEGVVVKKLDSPYQAGGRNFNWVKLKRHSSGELQDTVDCVILGYIFGRGKRTAFGAGALLVGVYDEKADEFVSVSKIGTGLTDEEWQSIKQRTKSIEQKTKPARINSIIVPSVWVRPEIVIEVLADEITRSPIHTAGMNQDQRSTRFAKASARREIKDQRSEEKEAGYALRFPRLVNFRDRDKKPEDATSVKELIEMYQQQGKK
ncbi:MAG TPA: ATP-dependent DNA ligase [Patescibacteria group bacterium]|nr:ATP-dependent DNA ligase [Patescibacteria group bacterium]